MFYEYKFLSFLWIIRFFFENHNYETLIIHLNWKKIVTRTICINVSRSFEHKSWCTILSYPLVFVMKIIQSTSSNINALFEFLVRFKSRLQQKPKAGNDYKSKTIPKMLIFALTLKCRKWLSKFENNHKNHINVALSISLQSFFLFRRNRIVWKRIKYQP